MYLFGPGTQGYSPVGSVLTAFCTGAFSAVAGTTYLEPGSTAVGCSANQGNLLGVPMPTACLAKNLTVKSGHVGVNASSGAVALLKNGSSILSCSAVIGTGTTCNSGASVASSSFAANDLWAISITGQTSEALSSISASFQCQ
jgi:hypothetical protein